VPEHVSLPAPDTLVLMEMEDIIGTQSTKHSDHEYEVQVTVGSDAQDPKERVADELPSPVKSDITDTTVENSPEKSHYFSQKTSAGSIPALELTLLTMKTIA